jgi:hypothetical protein
VLDEVLHIFVPDENVRRSLESLLIDMVFRYLFVAASARHTQAVGNSARFDQLLGEFLTRHTRLAEEKRDNFLKILKQAVLTSKGERPKSEVRDRLLAKQRHLACYLCGEGQPNRELQAITGKWGKS